MLFEITHLKRSENVFVYPVSVEKAIKDESGITLDIKLASLREDVDDLKDNVVRTDVQNLTEEQKAQARANIGVSWETDVVRTSPQTLTDEEQIQARENLGFGDGTIDTEPVENSQNLINSGAVHAAFDDITSIDSDVIDEIIVSGL